MESPLPPSRTAPDLLHWRFNLRMKMFLFGIVPMMVVGLLALAFVFLSMYQNLLRSGEEKIRADLENVVREMDRSNLQAVTVTRDMALAVENGLFDERDNIALFTRHVLEGYPDLTAAYIAFEPNADGLDAASLPARGGKGDPRAVDSTGRFVPRWSRDPADPGKLRLAPMTGLENLLIYAGVKNRHAGLDETTGLNLASQVSKYYSYSLDETSGHDGPILRVGQDEGGRMIFQETYPILLGGRFIGIAGIDRPMKSIQEFFEQEKRAKHYDFLLVSHRGIVISDTLDPRQEMSRIEETPWDPILRDRYRSHGETFARIADPVSRADYYYASGKVPTGDWTVVMRIPRQEVLAPIYTALGRVLAIVGVGALVVLTLLAFLIQALGNRIKSATTAAQQVAEGDLTVKVHSTIADETGQLLRAIAAMVAYLNSLVVQVRASSGKLTSTVEIVSAISKRQETMVNGFGSATAAVAASVNQISGTSQELVNTMNDVTRLAEDTADLADSGRAKLAEMEANMGLLSQAGSSVSEKLSVINSKASTISSIITTITKVAEQTNLLSLNAAIEAEKAGEYGLGFAVVAREIRRLADRTAVATLDIERMIRETQNSVTAGVIEMGRFNQDIQHGTSEAIALSAQFSKVIQHVQALSPRFEMVHEGMRSQSEGARQIGEAMEGLSDLVRGSAGSNTDLNQASEQLRAAIAALTDEISRFKV